MKVIFEYEQGEYSIFQDEANQERLNQMKQLMIDMGAVDCVFTEKTPVPPPTEETEI